MTLKKAKDKKTKKAVAEIPAAKEAELAAQLKKKRKKSVARNGHAPPQEESPTNAEARRLSQKTSKN